MPFVKAIQHSQDPAARRLFRPSFWDSILDQLLSRWLAAAELCLYQDFCSYRIKHQRLHSLSLLNGSWETGLLLEGFVQNGARNSIQRLFTGKDFEQFSNIIGRNATRNWVNLVNRFSADSEAIARAFDAHTSDLLVEAVCRLGDWHDGGQSVQEVLFSSGHKLLYKPKQPYSDLLFARFADCVNERVGDKLLAGQLLVARSDYCWALPVAHSRLQGAGASTRYYRSFGALICSAYFLGLRDLHFENVIASNGYVIPIDCECILAPGLQPQQTNISADFAPPIGESVASTGLLPKWESHGTLTGDISALTPDLSQIFVTTAGFKFAGTDRVESVVLTTEYKPTYTSINSDSAALDATQYLAELKTGFESVWESCDDSMVRFVTSPIDNQFMATDIRSRIVLRGTAEYTSILSDSLELPAVAGNGRRSKYIRERLLRSNFGRVMSAVHARRELNRSAVQNILGSEMKALISGDIPKFHAKSNHRNLYNEQGIVCKDQYAESGIQSFCRRLAKKSRYLADFQFELIKGSIRARNLTEPKAWKFASEEPERRDGRDLGRDVDEQVRAIADALLTLAVTTPSGGVGWMSSGLPDASSRVSYDLTDIGLYSGVAGICLFFIAAGTIFKDERLLAFADRADRDIALLLESRTTTSGLVEACGVGLATGVSGILYAAAVASTIKRVRPQPSIDSLVGAVERQLAESSIKTINHDLISGEPGVIIALLAYADASQGSRSLEVALDLGRRLAAEVVSQSIADLTFGGLAHGAWGTIFALARLQRISPSDLFAAALDKLVRAAGELGGGPDQTHRRAAIDPRHIGNGVTRQSSSWCWGAAGRAIALSEVNAIGMQNPIASSKNQIARELEVLKADQIWTDHICCGCSGLVEAGWLAHDPLAEERAIRRLSSGDLSSYRFFPQGYAQLINASLFRGLAGVGWTLLKHRNPTILPSVTRFETLPSAPQS